MDARRSALRDPLMVAFAAMFLAGLAMIGVGIEKATSNGDGSAVAKVSATAAPDEEAARVHRIAAARAERILHPEKFILVTSRPEHWPQGIIDHPSTPYPSGEFLSENAWQWDLHDRHVQVYAGRAGRDFPDSGRGLVIVREVSFDLKSFPGGGWFEAPPGTGSLHVEGYAGTLLTLRSSTGEVFFFDAATFAFTDEAGRPIPTDTPAPPGVRVRKATPLGPTVAPLPVGATATPAPTPRRRY